MFLMQLVSGFIGAPWRCVLRKVLETDAVKKPKLSHLHSYRNRYILLAIQAGKP
jgi:hypothetical protein